jgi:hypothetical protein
MEIGLDIATKMGVAYYNGKNIVTTVYVGDKHQQVELLMDVLGDVRGMTFFVEKLNCFVNADTTRSLLLRTGYITGVLEKMGANVEYVIATQARKFQGVSGKAEAKGLFPGLTSDEADAVVVLLYGLQKMHYNVAVAPMGGSKDGEFEV